MTDKEARRACGVTQGVVRQALAMATGSWVSAGSMSRWERGETRPRLLAHREAYARVYAGFRRHLASGDDGQGGPAPS